MYPSIFSLIYFFFEHLNVVGANWLQQMAAVRQMAACVAVQMPDQNPSEVHNNLNLPDFVCVSFSIYSVTLFSFKARTLGAQEDHGYDGKLQIWRTIQLCWFCEGRK